MKKLTLLLVIGALALSQPARAAVTVVSGPTALLTTQKTASASSAPIGLFQFSLSQNAGETVSSVTVELNKTASSTVSGTDLASLAVYKDNGDAVFDPASDVLAGSQSSININASTTVPVTSNNAIATTSTKFFVAISTGASWSDTAPPDELFAHMPANGIVTSSSSPTTTPVSTARIVADTTAPRLLTAAAKNTGGTSAKEGGDSIELTFSESTNKPTVASSTIASFFSVGGGHAFLDSTGMLGATSWNTAGTVLTITLSGSTTTIPTIATGDTIAVITPSAIADAAGNKATGSTALTGDFGRAVDDDDRDHKKKCDNGLINGRLYRVQGSDTVYLAAHCKLKVFIGKAVGKAHGKKFRNIITLSSLEGFTVIEKKLKLTKVEKREQKEERKEEKILRQIQEIKEKLQEKIAKLQEKLDKLRGR